ncbi:MAG: peptidyl-prolyl cis-trans isomerase [Sulfurovum sp.]|nr:peptidyl-prolyl cis-trans isomerase [Sulfurovum sp.]
MKKSIVLISFLLTLTYADMMGGIALTVNGECITTSEIRTLQRKAHVSKKQAIDLLIQDRLQKSAMKGIVIPESDIDKEISRIAEQNGFTIKKMQQLLKKQGSSWGKYRESIRNALKQRKFFRETVAKNIPQPTESELKRFYDKHKKEFNIPSTISVTEYSAPTEEKIKQFLKNKNTKGVKSKRQTKKTKGMNSAMLGMLLQTPNGSYTAPINAGDKWVVYKVHAKNGRTQMPFENAKGAVAARWRQQQQGKAVKDYFQKMKTEADIKYLRK